MYSNARQERGIYKISCAKMADWKRTHRSKVMPIIGAGPRMRLDPPKIAIFDSPDLMVLQARCIATRLELQAVVIIRQAYSLGYMRLPVSIVTLGPLKSKK
jgi:hypothetical protein